MAFEMLEEALLQLKQKRQNEEMVEAQRQNAATAATMQFAVIKSEVLRPIFDKAATLLTDEGLFAEVTDQEHDTTRSIALKVDLSTEKLSIARRKSFCLI